MTVPVLMVAAACTPEAPPLVPVEIVETSRHATSGLELAPVRVITAEATHIFQTELALTTEDQAKGLMFRTALADDEAMLFPSTTPQSRSFWMKNTPIPLDIIFIGPDMRIINIEPGVPYSLESVSSAGPAIAVFEIRGGLSEELGISPGDTVEYTLPE